MTTSRSFARLSTLVHAWSFFRLSLKGRQWRDKWLMFLLCSLASAGRHRKKGRAWLLARINGCAEGESVAFHSQPPGVPREIRFEMRRGNECDFLIGGELVQGIYSIHDRGRRGQHRNVFPARGCLLSRSSADLLRAGHG